MQIDTSLNGQTLAVKLEGRLDTTTAPQVEETLKDVLETCDSCVLDLANVDYISSAGLRLLLSLHKRMAAAGGKFKIRNVQPGVQDILDMTGFSSFLAIE